MGSACALPRSRAPASRSLPRRGSTCPAERGSGLFPPLLASPSAESWGGRGVVRLPAHRESLCGRAGPVCRSVGPAAARYVRAQGLWAGVTDREREIPGGGGAVLPWSRCQRRRLPKTWLGERLCRKGNSPRRTLPGSGRSERGGAGSCPRWGTPPGKRGAATAARRDEERARLSLSRRGALEREPGSCGKVSPCPPSPPGSPRRGCGRPADGRCPFKTCSPPVPGRGSDLWALTAPLITSRAPAPPPAPDWSAGRYAAPWLAGRFPWANL